MKNACLPVGYSWTSPFARWGGSLADFSSLDVGAVVTRAALEARQIDGQELSDLVLGWTVPQPQIFYGAPTLAGRVGAGHISGPMVSQACATGVAALQVATSRVSADGMVLVATVDRTSNSPHLVYPSRTNPGGAPDSEDWMLDNFKRDPWAGSPMLDTAEAVASELSATREELDELTLMRYEQYRSAISLGVQERYVTPASFTLGKRTLVVAEDEGIHKTTREGLAALAPADPDGVHTYGSQTHPADAAAGMLVMTVDRARELSNARGIARVLGFGWSRVEKARMPKAPAPAALAALADAGLRVTDLDVITTHNPFAVNDLWLSRELGVPLEKMNPYGCSLVYGHPQAPTGTRAITELIEALSARGGGVGLFTGCAAGDTAGAVVVRVD